MIILNCASSIVAQRITPAAPVDTLAKYLIGEILSSLQTRVSQLMLCRIVVCKHVSST